MRWSLVNFGMIIPVSGESIDGGRVPAGGPPTGSVYHQGNGEAEEGANTPHGTGDPADEPEDEAHIKVVEPLAVRQLASGIGHLHADDVSIEDEETLVADSRVVEARSGGHGTCHMLVLEW